MPYSIHKRDGKFCVVAKDTGKTAGCHASQKEALAQMRALYVNVPEARKGSEDDDDSNDWLAELEVLINDDDDSDLPITTSESSTAHSATDPPENSDDSERPSRTFFSRLYELLKSSVSRDAFDTAVRGARAHAGGRAKAERSKLRTKVAYDPYLLADAPMGVTQFTKTDARVSYSEAESAYERCGMCAFWQSGTCRIVEGQISANGYCDLFLSEGEALSMSESFEANGDAFDVVTLAASANAKDESDRYGPVRLYIDLGRELRQFAEFPEWIQYMPRPGVYTHDQWGKVVVSKERNQQFVDNFKRGAYQTMLPIDGEHNTKVTGALSWITDMQMSEDGSIKAKIEPTARGRKMLSDDAFRYFSPEWYDEWIDPADLDRTVQTNIAVGGAFTTRPFFKEAALDIVRRPLIASEYAVTNEHGGSLLLQGESVTYPFMLRDEEINIGGETVGMSEEELRQFAEIREQMTTMLAENAALKSANETLSESAKAATERVAALESGNRRMRFSELIEGRDSNDSAPWIGETSHHVAMLEHLADAVGEDSDLFKNYIANERAKAEQEMVSVVFDEIGQRGDRSRGDPTVEFNARVLRTASEEKLSYVDAMEKVAKSDPAAYDRYRKASATKV